MMGGHRAFALLVMGRTLGATDAQAAGLINDLVEEGGAETAALKAAQEIAALPPEAVKLGRKLMRGDAQDMVAVIDAEARVFGERIRSKEAIAAFSAFLARK
ncbi:NADH dehydrogenase subunit E [Platysternon megacephalum]|uniref:NADH dehydrogenase subunit E n=1 Tax=Platysternon megacephalum TaxID=55544 RepID=A0A4D9DEC5_9SAUR|nr:NADH dehydrogenase subunit E [Platysternon megacephalum]